MSKPHGGHEHHKGENPLVIVMASVTGAAAQEHENAPPGVDKTSVKAGHEPDAFNVKAILYVPALVAVTLVFTYIVVQVIFSTIRNPEASPGSNPQVMALNDLNFDNRVGRISSTEPREVLNRPGTTIPQPRLEFIREQGGDDPVYYRSKRALQDRNSPEIRPEDLRAENYVDPATGQKILAEYAFVGDKQKNIIRVPIDEAIHLFEHGNFKLPVRKDPVKLSSTSDAKAKLSNGGVPLVSDQKDTVPSPHAPKNDPAKKHDH